MRITIQHSRALNHCVKGMQHFCKKYNLDFRAFIKDGIDEQILLDTQDQLGIDLVNFANKQEKEGI